jgi:PX domain
MIFLYLYCVLSIIPILFIAYAVVRIKRHWKDGEDKFIVLNKHVYFKWFLSLVMTLITIMHIVDLYLFSLIDQLEAISRGIFFILQLIACLASFFLGIFENNKGLLIAWIGHRSFWPLNLIIQSVLGISEGYYVLVTKKEYKNTWANLIIVAYSVQIICCMILTVYAIRRPNEFLKIGEDNYYFITKSVKKTLTNQLIDDLCQYPKISINSYKIKQECSKPVIYFNIMSSIKSQFFSAKRSLQEFETLNQQILDKFPLRDYPNLCIPPYPKMNAMAVEDRMKALEEYLNHLASSDFMIFEYLDFLKIKEPLRTELMSCNEDLVRKNSCFEIPESRSTSILEKYYNPKTYESELTDNMNEIYLQKYVYITISKWIEIGAHIEYIVDWNIPYLELNGSVQKRYNEFLDFHKSLSKIVSPAKLPSFPRKSYLRRLQKIDEKALSTRKVQLQNYLSHILNDTAFLCNEVLEFLNIPTSIEKIWSFEHPVVEIKLIAPISCYPEIDDSSHYLKYPMKFCKFFNKIKQYEWSITKRYKEFDEMHNFMFNRTLSPVLIKYYEYFNHKILLLPVLPPKTVGSLINPLEIENRRLGLEKYLEELFSLPLVYDAYIFRQFINDSQVTENYLIN